MTVESSTPKPAAKGEAASSPRKKTKPDAEDPIRDSGPYGAVAILDALGTRGRWNRENPDEVVSQLYAINRRLRWIPPAVAFRTPEEDVDVYPGDEFELDTMRVGGDTIQTWELDTFYFSDTLILTLRFTTDDWGILEYFAHQLAKWFVESIRKGVLYRGAISTGHWVRKGNILVGTAVDEAAEWHEKADWAGIMLTPSAWSAFSQSLTDEENDVVSLCKYDIPLHDGKRFDGGWAVNWPRFLPESRGNVERLFLKAPVAVSEMRKLTNTLQFYDKFDRRLPWQVSRSSG
jgi:hypothetical protein